MKIIREYDEYGHWQAEYIPPDEPSYFWTDLLGVIIGNNKAIGAIGE